MAKSAIREPKSEKALATKRAIREATAHILLRSGIDSLSTNSIAEKAGVSIGSLYQYYKSKDEILLELVEKIFERKQNQMKEALELSMLLESIETIISRVVDAAINYNDPDDSRLETMLIPICLQNSNKNLVVRLVENFENFAKPAMKALLLMKNPSLRKRDLDTMIFIMIQSMRGIVIALAMPWGKHVDKELLKKEFKILIEGYVGKKSAVNS